jgi:hypothetical protein
MDIIGYLEGLHDRCLELSKHLHFDRHHKLHFDLASLYGSLIELVGCILILVKNNAKLGIPSLFRTFLETYVEFHNLVRDSKYGYYREASYLKEWLKLLRNAKESENPYLVDIKTLPNLAAIIHEHESQFQDLQKLGYKPLKIYEKFKRADMLEEYESMYNFLSRESHSNISALINRHTDIIGNDYKLTFYKNDPIEKYLQYIDSSAGLLLSATGDIHNHFGSDVLDPIKELKKELDIVRSKIRVDQSNGST